MPSFSWNEGKTHCCGVMEIGAFSNDNMAERGFGSWQTVTADTAEELWPEVFKRMCDKTAARNRQGWARRRGSFAHIWFKKPRGERQYEFADLMKQFKQSDKVWNLGSFINPNTNNRIQGYGIKIHGR